MNQLLKYATLLVFLSIGCTRHFVPSAINASHCELKGAKDDSLTLITINKYKGKMNEGLKEVIAVSDSVLTKEGTESTLANFVMQAMEFYTGQNKPELKNNIIPIINKGGLRINLPKGPITVETIYELMPFDNEIVFIKISGKNLNEALQSFCANGKLFSKNIHFYIDKNKAINIQYHKELLADQAEYWIVLTDYLANGGDHSSFFKDPIEYHSSGVKLRDAIISYCRFLTKNNQSIIPYKDGRITVRK